MTLVSPGDAFYSGLATGALAGERAPEDVRVDLAALAARAGAFLVRGAVSGLDRGARLARLADGRSLPYDALAFALGSVVATLPGAETAPGRVFSAKPIEHLLGLRPALEARLAAGEAPRVVVAGGGAAAVECAACLLGLAGRRGGRARVTLLSPGRPLPGLPDGVAGTLLADLGARGLAVERGRALSVRDGAVATERGAVPFDLLLLATGPRPPPVLAALGLPLGPWGGVLVDRHLRSPADPRIHASGDAAEPAGLATARSGVQAVRQAPALRASLLAALEGGAPGRYRRRSTSLWIMNLGDGTALARFGPLGGRGRWALRWKDRLDRRFLAALRG